MLLLHLESGRFEKMLLHPHESSMIGGGGLRILYWIAFEVWNLVREERRSGI
jgi:hypothetical protein